MPLNLYNVVPYTAHHETVWVKIVNQKLTLNFLKINVVRFIFRASVPQFKLYDDSNPDPHSHRTEGLQTRGWKDFDFKIDTIIFKQLSIFS